MNKKKTRGSDDLSFCYLSCRSRSRLAEDLVDRTGHQVRVGRLGHGHLHVRVHVHGLLDCVLGTGVASPGSASQAVAHVPSEHVLGPSRGLGRAIQDQAEAAVDDLAPADTATVVDRDPGGSAHGVADDVVDRHVRAEHGAVTDVGRLPVGRVRTAHVVVVATDHHRTAQQTIFHCLVEGQGDRDASLSVRVQDAGLAAHVHLVTTSFLDPLQVVQVLLLDLGTGFVSQASDDTVRDAVRDLEIIGVSRAAHPAEGTEAVVEAHGTHDVFHIAGPEEGGSFFVHDHGPGLLGFEQEGVAVVPEVHPAIHHVVDVHRVSPQGGGDRALELLGILHHHGVGFFQAHSSRVVATTMGVVQGSLVRAKVHMNFGIVQSFPQVDDVAQISERHRFFVGDRLLDAADQDIEVVGGLVQPALVQALVQGSRVDLRDHTHCSGNHRGLGLRTTHAAEA